MFNLIKLELRKIKPKHLAKGIAIADLGILAMLTFMCVISKVEQEDLFANGGDFIIFSELLTLATFIIYGSVILAKLTVSEYKNKTIQLLFMYPISRKKLLVAKVIIVYCFVLCAVVISNLVNIPYMYVLEAIMDVIPANINFDILVRALPMLIVCAFVSGFLTLVPLYFGMIKKSTGRMIATAVIVVSLTTSSMGSLMSIKAYLLRVVVLGAIAIASVLLTMKYTLDNIDSVDID